MRVNNWGNLLVNLSKFLYSVGEFKVLNYQRQHFVCFFPGFHVSDQSFNSLHQSDLVLLLEFCVLDHRIENVHFSEELIHLKLGKNLVLGLVLFFLYELAEAFEE